MSLVGRFAVVTGASSGIGRSSAILLAQEGAQVGLTGRNQPALEKVVNEIKQLPGVNQNAAFFIVADTTVEKDVENAIATFVKMSDNSRIDILINCAGVLKGGSVDATSMETWDLNMNVNARGLFCFMNKSIPFMARSKNDLSAAIVNVSSVNGLQSFAGVAAYCASKAAVDMLTDCAAVDLAPKNIRVNAINPGVIRTELQKRGGMNEEAYEAFVERSIAVTHPLGRIGNPEEVAQAILFLADSNKSGFTTGTHLTVDGGRRCIGAR